MIAESRCASCGAELAPAARFCSACGTPVPAAVEVEPPGSEVPPVPPELRRRFEEVRAELRGERREVVVLFADLSGFTAMSETMDPEEVTLLMNRLLQDLAATVYEYEGYVDKFIGDAIMALFGAPLAHEDDPERAVLAGLAMIDVVARRNVGAEKPLALRVGINLGEVVAAHLGTEGRLQYTVLGDAVNLASRLEGKAEPDTVLVSQAVHARVADRFGAVELAPLEVKGKAQPVQAFRITGYARGAVADGGTPFVGREAELEALASFLARTAAGEPGALLVEAEAGGGKTRLVREALARAGPGVEVARIDFTPIRLPGQRPPAGALFAELVGGAAEREDAAELSGAGDPVAHALALLDPRGAIHQPGLEGLAREADPGGTPEPEEADPQASRQRRWTALAALLQAPAARPRLLWLEDVHWAGEAAAELLAFLLPAIAHAPAGVLMTARTGEAAAWLPADVERVPIAPLGEADVTRLLGDRVLDLPPLQRRDLIRRAQGNPLFLEELLRALRAGVAAAGAVPGTVQGLIQSRIDRLPPPEEGLLHMASVLGGRFPLPLLRRVYALESQAAPFDRALHGLEAGGFIELCDGTQGEGAFRHALMQEVAYGGILLRVRRVLHESAARLGEELFADRREAEAPFFAHHYWEAGLKADAAPHLWSAGRRAADEYDLHAAERHLKRAAEVLGDAAGGTGQAATGLEDPEQRARFSERFGWVLLHRGDLDGAEGWYHALAAQGRESGRSEWEARGIGQLGLVAWYRGRLEEARKLFERGIAMLPAGEERLAADLHNHLGLVAYYRGAPEQAFTEHAEALRLRESIGDRLGMAKSYGNIGNLLLDFREDLDGAEEHYTRALELGREVGDRQIVTATLNCLGNVAMERGEWRRAADVFREAQLVLEEIGWPHLRYVTLLSQAVCETALGRIETALGHLRTCREEGDAILEPINRVNLRVFQFDAYLRAFADEEAERALQDAARVAEELEVEEREQIRLREGRWLAARSRWPEAAKAFAEAAAAARAFNHPSTDELARAHLCRAETYAGGRDVAACVTETEAKRGHRALVEYLNADAAAAQGELERADRALADVVGRAAALGEVALEWAAAERLADVRGRLGDAAGAAEALGRAVEALERLEAGLPADLRENFARHPRVAALRERAAAARPLVGEISDRAGRPARP